VEVMAAGKEFVITNHCCPGKDNLYKIKESFLGSLFSLV
jgi:hypothetical protein